MMDQESDLLAGETCTEGIRGAGYVRLRQFTRVG